MKILHIYKTYYPENLGGVERVIHSISAELVARGLVSDIVVCSKKNTRTERLDRSQVYYFKTQWEGASCPISFSMLRNFKKIAANYDVLNYHFPWPFGDFMHLALAIKKPTVVSYHSDIVRQVLLKRLYSPVMHCFFNQVGRIVASSENLIKNSDVLKAFQQKVSVIPYGINQEQYPAAATALLDIWRKRVGVNFFLFVGVLRYYKGLDYLLEAVRNTQIPLVIAGSGPEETKLHHYVMKHGIENVTFLGRITDENKIALLTLCRAVVSPAHLRSEAFCVSLLEGLLFGKPLISTEIGTGTSFTNQHGLSGIVVSPRDSSALRDAMLTLMTNNKLYVELQRGAREHYSHNFTASKMCDDYFKIYKEMV